MAITNLMEGFSVVFLGTVPGLDHLIQVSAGCDCEVEIEDVTRLLDHIYPLE
jgi:hypothetical protein